MSNDNQHDPLEQQLAGWAKSAYASTPIPDAEAVQRKAQQQATSSARRRMVLAAASVAAVVAAAAITTSAVVSSRDDSAQPHSGQTSSGQTSSGQTHSSQQTSSWHTQPGQTPSAATGFPNPPQSAPAEPIAGTVIGVFPGGPDPYIDGTAPPAGQPDTRGQSFTWSGSAVEVYWRKDADQLVVTTFGGDTCRIVVSSVTAADANPNRPDVPRIVLAFQVESEVPIQSPSPASEVATDLPSEMATDNTRACPSDTTPTTTIVQPPAGITSAAGLSIQFANRAVIEQR